MMRTMVYLPEALHKSMKHLAVERGVSFAKLVQEALEALYKDDVEDLQAGRERLHQYLAKPDKALRYVEYRDKRSKK